MKGKGKTINESIRIEAYLLSEKAGHPAGMEHYFWTQAEAIVHARATAVSKAVKAAASKPVAGRKTKPKVAATPKVETKAVKKAVPKAVVKPPVKGANGKAHQISLNGILPAATGKRAPKK